VNNLKYVFGREGGIIAGKSFDLARKRRTQAPLTTTRDLACLTIGSGGNVFKKSSERFRTVGAADYDAEARASSDDTRTRRPDDDKV
jgi:hypothetical protein